MSTLVERLKKRLSVVARDRCPEGVVNIMGPDPDCNAAAERITELERMLSRMTDLARSHAAKTGPMHAWWDSIMDAEATLKDQPTLRDWSKSSE